MCSSGDTYRSLQDVGFSVSVYEEQNTNFHSETDQV